MVIYSVAVSEQHVIEFLVFHTSGGISSRPAAFLWPKICLCIIYINVYIFTNLISTSIHGTRKKTKKNLTRNKRKKYLESPPRGKRKKEKILGQKERKGQPRPTPWKKSRDTQSVVKRKPKNPPRILQCYNY